jgi:CHAT domain-containing protein
MKSFLAPIDSAQLTAEVRRLRQLLEKRTTHEYREPAGKLYDWLIRPLEQDLKANRAEALVFVSGGALRSIPMTALYDRKEKRFLIEKYPIVATPGLTLIEPRKIDRGEIQLLKGGLTQSVRGYPALAYVGEELEAIQEAFGGTTLLNERFVVPAIHDALSNAPFGIVHLASHGEFGGDPENTFLLTFDGRMKMGELTEMVGTTRFREKALEMLALSACETAAGDDRAALGLAGVAVKAGARSTLATLWRINDHASAQLVAEFYRQLSRPEVSRGVALQRAQLRLLEQPGFRHPAYWSPFILVGSWL